MIDWRPFYSGEKKSIFTKKYHFCVWSQISTLSRSTSSKGFIVHRAQTVANNISKNLNSHKRGVFVTKFVMGGLGPQKFSTFGPSDASRKKTIEFHIMRAIAFYSPCLCLSNRVWHKQIVSCTIVTYPNNFKCHETIFTIFCHQKNALLSWANSPKLNSSNARCHPLIWTIVISTYYHKSSL